MSERDVGRVSVRLYRDGDETRLRELGAGVFGRERSAAYWAWRNRDGPDGPSLIHLLEADGEIVGQMVHTPFSTWVDGAKVMLGQSGDTFVLRGFQGPAGMKRLIQAFAADDSAFGVRMNFPGDRSARLMELFEHGTVVGRIPTWVRSHGRGASLPQPAKQLVRIGGRATSAALALPPPVSVRVERLDRAGPELDELAASSATFARCIRVRDASYVQWRWLDQPDAAWHVRAARSRRGGALRGWAVHGGIGRSDALGKIVDLLAADATAARALLLDAYRESVRAGLRGAVVEYQDPRRWSRRALMRAGFLPARPTTRVMVKGLSSTIGSSIERLDSWYLTAGDQDWTKE